MRAFAKFIASASLRTRGAPEIRPIATRSTVAQGNPFPDPLNAPTAPTFTMLYPSQLQFVPSPLSNTHGLGFAEIDAICASFRNHTVEGLAGVVAAKLARLHEIAGYRSAVSAAVKSAMADQPPGKTHQIRSEAVAQKLRDFAEHLDEQIECALEDKRLHNNAAHLATLRHQRLVDAVRAKNDALHVERRSLLSRVDAAQRAVSLPDPAQDRYEALISLGLSNGKIAMLGPFEKPSPKPQIDAMQARIQEINALVPHLAEFLADPLRDAAPLVSLGLFDAEIAERANAEVQA